MKLERIVIWNNGTLEKPRSIVAKPSQGGLNSRVQLCNNYAPIQVVRTKERLNGGVNRGLNLISRNQWV